MADFLVRRILISILTLLIISLIVFTGVRLIPGDPARVMAGTDADPAGLEEIRQKYGLNDPIVVQYLRWVGLAVRGDLGESIRTRESVVLTVARKLPITMELACLAVLVALADRDPGRRLLGGAAQHRLGSARQRRVPVRDLHPELLAGHHADPAPGGPARAGCPPRASCPFWQHPLGNLQRMVMPAFVLGAGLAAVLMRQTRNSMIEVLSADYIRTAYSKGLAQRVVIFRHAIRNGLIPVVTILGLADGGAHGRRRGDGADLRGARASAG